MTQATMIRNPHARRKCTERVDAETQLPHLTAMVNSALRPDAGLGEVLAARARTASDKRLVADVLGGLLVAAVTLIWRPHGWFLFSSAAVCFAAFGCWGVADRELTESAHQWGSGGTRVLKLMRIFAAVAGALASAALMWGFLALGLGTWKS
jgi:hypothetical protein